MFNEYITPFFHFLVLFPLLFHLVSLYSSFKPRLRLNLMDETCSHCSGRWLLSSYGTPSLLCLAVTVPILLCGGCVSPGATPGSLWCIVPYSLGGLRLAPERPSVNVYSGSSSCVDVNAFNMHFHLFPMPSTLCLTEATWPRCAAGAWLKHAAVLT